MPQKMPIPALAVLLLLAPPTSVAGFEQTADTGSDCATYVIEPVVVPTWFSPAKVDLETGEAWAFVEQSSSGQEKSGLLTGRYCQVSLEDILCSAGNYVYSRCIVLDAVEEIWREPGADRVGILLR